MKDREHIVMMRRTANIHRHQVLRAAKTGQQLDYTLDQLRAWVRKHLDTPCPSCGQPLKAANISVDHETPTSRAGGYGRANIRFLCLRCNQIKGALTANEFTELTTLLSTWPSEAAASVLRRLRAGGQFTRN
jgi:5-methylcytosine-specific restriction endonuclease McrA